MSAVTVIATKDFTANDGMDVHAGEAVTLAPIEAAVRGRAGEVSLDPRARATYQRRDLNAEPVAPASHVSSDTPATPKRARRRRTRKAIETT